MLLIYDTQLIDNKNELIYDVKNISILANKERGTWEARVQTRSEFFKADIKEINVISVENSTALQIYLDEKKKITV